MVGAERPPGSLPTQRVITNRGLALSQIGFGVEPTASRFVTTRGGESHAACSTVMARDRLALRLITPCFSICTRSACTEEMDKGPTAA